MGLREYVEDLRKAINIIEKHDRVVVAHHNDADGLSSVTIVMEALRRKGIEAVNIPLERVHPLIVKKLLEKYADLIMFVDLGAGAAPEISKINAGKHMIIIIDHHHTPGVNDPKIMNLSTELYGISGDREISASGAAYIFAITMDSRNHDLAYMGVTGAIGDSHHRFGRLESINRQILFDAVAQKQVAVEEVNGKEKYYLTVFGDKIDLDKFAKSLTVLGAVGYLMGGPDIGIETLLEGPTEKYKRTLDKLNELKREKFNKVIEKLKREGLYKSKYLQWLHVHDFFNPMGVKVIGEFCMEIRNNQEIVDPNMYLAGFQDMPKEVPKLGRFNWNIVKVSFRLPSKLEEKVLAGEMPGYDYLVPRAAKHVGGDIDACHGYACATTFEKGLEEEFAKYFDYYVEEYIKQYKKKTVQLPVHA